MKEKSGRQLASGMKAISLSTLQRKTGGHRQGLRAILENTVSQLSAVQLANFPNEAARVLGVLCLPVLLGTRHYSFSRKG